MFLDPPLPCRRRRERRWRPGRLNELRLRRLLGPGAGIGCRDLRCRRSFVTAALVEAEVPNDSNHDCGPDADWAEPAKDREDRKADDYNEGDPQFLWPAPDGLAEQVIHRRSVATLDRDQQPSREIEHKPDTAAQREQDPSNSYQQWIDPPVLRHTAAKTCEFGIRRTTSDRPDR